MLSLARGVHCLLKKSLKIFALALKSFTNLLLTKRGGTTGTLAIQGTSREKSISDKLSLETLKSRRWLRRLCCMYKVINIGILNYLTDLNPKHETGYNMRNRNKPFFELQD